MQLVDKVDSIEVTTVALPDKLGTYLHIHAVGHVGETGWVMPRLLRRFSRGRAEKTLELSFAADPPYGLVGEIELPIVAGFFIEFEDWMKKVKVYDSKGSVEKPINPRKSPIPPAHPHGVKLFKFSASIANYQDSFQPTGTIHWKNDGYLNAPNPHSEWKKLDHHLILSLTSRIPAMDEIQSAFNKAFTQGVLASITQLLLTGDADEAINTGVQAFEVNLQPIIADLLDIGVHDESNWEYWDT